MTHTDSETELAIFAPDSGTVWAAPLQVHGQPRRRQSSGCWNCGVGVPHVVSSGVSHPLKGDIGLCRGRTVVPAGALFPPLLCV